MGKDTMRVACLFLIVIGAILLAGCVTVPGKACNVLVEKDGGVISIPVTDKSTEERANREKARSLIMLKCGTNYEITREEEVEVGVVEETVVSHEISSNSNKMVVRSKKCEYRLTYRCK